jgi:hypothetical protein
VVCELALKLWCQSCALLFSFVYLSIVETTFSDTCTKGRNKRKTTLHDFLSNQVETKEMLAISFLASFSSFSYWTKKQQETFTFPYSLLEPFSCLFVSEFGIVYADIWCIGCTAVQRLW